MKKSIYYMLFILAGCISICTANAQSLFDGDYKGQYSGTNTVVNLKLHNANQIVTGIYAEENNPEAEYAIEGKIIEGILHGKMICTTAPILQFEFTCKQSGGNLYFRLDNEFWVYLIPPITLTRTAVTSSTFASPSGTTKMPLFDERLVGKWKNTKIYRSGEFSNITTQLMVIEPGAFLSIYEPSAANSTDNSYVNSSGGDLIARVKILVDDNKIYVIGEDGVTKGLLASYVISEDKLQTTAPDGLKEFWNK